GDEMEEPLLSSSHTGYWRRSVNLEIDLEPGEYVVHVRLDREMTRPANYLSEKAMKPRKLSRVLTEQMQAKSVAVNFDGGLSRHLRVARGTYAAKDLTELEMIRLQPNPEILEEPGEDEGGETQEDGEEEGEEEAEEENNEETGEGGEQQEEVGVTIQNEDEAPSGPVHNRRCNECGVCPIVGPLYHCMDISCEDYDACQPCMSKGEHPGNHRLVQIYDPGRTSYLSKVAEDDSDNAITVGLRVYTKTSSPVTVNGQLRHGSVIHWTKEAI
ncbi:hypothetical protein FRC09_009104, partial [Ceratobasidium sp. 395]